MSNEPEKDKKESGNIKILKKGALKLGFYGVKYSGLPGVILQGTAAAAAMTGLITPAGIIGSVIIIGILYFCSKKSNRKKDNQRKLDYENMLKNAELYEAKQKETEEMRYMELLNDIFHI